MGNHDHSYKLLFSHAEMVADLLRGFVHEEWVRELDFSTLQKVNANWTSDRLRRRDSDVVWRLRWGKDRWLYVYLLLEFQSTNDPFMAVRVMVYVGLLYQDLIHQGLIPPGSRLPPVLPVVLYNGIPPWLSAQDIFDLIETVPGGLEKYQPHSKYFLLDEGRIADSELAPLRNLAAALFRLEKSRGPAEIQTVVEALLEWLQAPEQAEMRRSFSSWLSKVLLPARLPGIEIPGLADLQEVKTMLAERVMEWTREWEQEGFQKGHERGLLEGHEKGREEALSRVRDVLVHEIERRFGPIPTQILQRIEEIRSFEEVVTLSMRAATAPSLDALGLA
jgi:predicted transposase/invertase (TIGR01784 family)